MWCAIRHCVPLFSTATAIALAGSPTRRTRIASVLAHDVGAGFALHCCSEIRDILYLDQIGMGMSHGNWIWLMHRNFPETVRRCVSVCAMCVLFCGGCGDEPTASNVSPTDGNAITAADYSLLLLMPRLAADLELDGAQRVSLAVWRPDFQRKLRAATHSTGVTASEPASVLIDRGTEQLTQSGKLVEQLLTESQKSAFGKLRSEGRISGIQVLQSESGQIGVSYDAYEEARNTRARFRASDALREIQNVSDATAVLKSSDGLVRSYGARWLLERRDTVFQHSNRLHDILEPLVGVGDQPQRGALIALFCLVADKRDSDLLRQIVEHPGEDRDDILPALRVLIRENPTVANRLLRARLDDLWWHDEALRLFAELGRDAYSTLGQMSDILHPNWREPIRELLQGSGHETSDSRVTEQRIEWAIEQFCSNDAEHHQMALAWLAGAEPADAHRDTRVTCLLRSMLDSTWEDARVPLVTAFSRWASEEDLPVLLKLLEAYEADREGAGLAVDALLRLDPVLVRNLLAPPDADDRFRTGTGNPYFSIVAGRVSLITEHAESTLLLLYEIPEERLRIAVCRAMSRQGTDRSVRILSASLKTDSLTERMQNELTRTISQIQSR